MTFMPSFLAIQSTKVLYGVPFSENSDASKPSIPVARSGQLLEVPCIVSENNINEGYLGFLQIRICVDACECGCIEGVNFETLRESLILFGALIYQLMVFSPSLSAPCINMAINKNAPGRINASGSQAHQRLPL